jgi:release factor glutamine methyltransferase
MSIYQPAEDSFLLQKYVRKYADGRVLDMGTGSGIQALTAIETANVKELVAIDINEEAVVEFRNKVPASTLRKITVRKSDLFDNVDGHFNLIIFNPPYLPQDKVGGKIIDDPALYGGKKGWETSERFFQNASKHLFPGGKILFLFSSLTDKKKIDEIIKNNLFQFQQLEEKKLPLFETLYVYEIERSELLREIEKKFIEDIRYFAKGKRGLIYTGVLDKSKLIKTHFSKTEIVQVAIKAKKEESEALATIANEAKWLQILNRAGIGPRYVLHTEKFVVYEFVEGEYILDWIRNNEGIKVKKLLKGILEQCRFLDQRKVNKEEMHHPLKHIIVTKEDHPIMLDFERCSDTDKPQNVTQFVEFICRIEKELEKRGVTINVLEFRTLAGKYKETFDQAAFKNILRQFQ